MKKEVICELKDAGLDSDLTYYMLRAAENIKKCGPIHPRSGVCANVAVCVRVLSGYDDMRLEVYHVIEILQTYDELPRLPLQQGLTWPPERKQLLDKLIELLIEFMDHLE